MTSTHEAFSLPTSSPSQSSHPDAFSGEALSTAQYPGSSYSYPPPSAGPYYDVPPTVSRSGPTSILPIHRNSPHHCRLTPHCRIHGTSETLAF
ncbi:hypothetical protein A0H81_10825 [Grifola frondosa]|uniref:Uncharacterized protein n=1 Tax=Grifola frondosa TaxID=5627 RepID=A0A1C7LYZ5_GRIFR|nr:hypothetical protein A0H81_10825 [Grifola frondosa]